MSDDVGNPDLKDNDDLEDGSIPFMYMAAGVGIKFIDSDPNDPDVLRRLRQILMDIQKELTESASQGNDTGENLLSYHCYQCASIFRNDPVGYANCLATCVP